MLGDEATSPAHQNEGENSANLVLHLAIQFGYFYSAPFGDIVHYGVSRFGLVQFSVKFVTAIWQIFEHKTVIIQSWQRVQNQVLQIQTISNGMLEMITQLKDSNRHYTFQSDMSLHVFIEPITRDRITFYRLHLNKIRDTVESK